MYQKLFGANGDVWGHHNCATAIINRPSQPELLTEVLKRKLEEDLAREIATQLINKLGDIKHVLRASPAKLAKILNGKGSVAIDAISETRILLETLIEDSVCARPLLEEFSAVTQYCRSFLSDERREQFHLLMLDQYYCLLGHECLQVGTIDHVAVYPREVMATALSYNAVSIILVHNHPGGSAQPSQADIHTTKLLATAGRYIGVDITDHIIIGSKMDFSFREAGILPWVEDRQKPDSRLKYMRI